MLFEIPLNPEPQSFSIILGGTEYRMVIAYRNVEEGGWSLDIYEPTGTPIVLGIPLITGADLLEQYQHLKLPGKLFVRTDGSVDSVPTFDNLGLSSHLYFEAAA